MGSPDVRVEMAAAPRAGEGEGTALWVWQRVSGALLAVLVVLHLLVTHVLPPGGTLTFGIVSERLYRVVFVAVDVGLLGMVIFHALNGVRNVLLDFPVSQPALRWAHRVLVGLGVGTFAYGLLALLPFIRGAS